MTTLARASLASLRKAHTMPEVHWVLSAAVVAAGWAGVHALFGALLCSMVTLIFLRRSQRDAVGSRVELLGLARHLSRLVYLILYGVLLLRLLREALGLPWHGGVHWGLSPHFLLDPEQAFIEIGEGFRVELLWGVVALCLIRALAAYQMRAAAARAIAVNPSYVFLSGQAAQKE